MLFCIAFMFSLNAKNGDALSGTERKIPYLHHELDNLFANNVI